MYIMNRFKMAKIYLVNEKYFSFISFDSKSKSPLKITFI